jgi:dienelactone hydrolase
MRATLLVFSCLVSLCASVSASAQQAAPPAAVSPVASAQPDAGPTDTSLPYLIATPPGHAPDQPSRLVVVLPPGTQSEEIARATMDRSFGTALASRGFVVVMPYSPDGRTPLDGDDVGDVFGRISSEMRVTSNQAIIVGIQNGARAAFEFAVGHPDRATGLMLMPGMPPRDWAAGEDRKRMIDSLRGIPVAMFVGSEDARWRDEMQPLARDLNAAGIACSLTVVKGDGHALSSLTTNRIVDTLHRLSLLSAGATPEKEVGIMLDAWHDAAARADENAYFAHFADESSIFMGTDATERWTATEFRAWAKPYFDRRRAWSFKVVERHTYLSPDETTAWFDEVLDTPNMGPCRGSGVAVKRDDTWKIAHYNLTVPVPNAILDKVVEMVAEELKNPTPPTPQTPPPADGH